MKKPIIAVDVDDVLSASALAFVRFSNERWGTHLTIDDVNEDWTSMWQVDHVEAERRAREFHKSGLISTYDHYDEALPVLQHLQNEYELVVATSRNSRVDAETRAWLDERYAGIFSSVYFSGIYDVDTIGELSVRRTKGALLEEIGAAYLIDDQPKHCLGAVERGMRAVLFGSYPWNNSEDLPPGVARCANWSEVREYFDAIRS